MSSNSSHIPVADDGDDDYSYDSDDDTLITLASTVRAYRYQHNRRYHDGRTGTHPYPNDKRSADNEEILHLLFLKLFNDKPYIAPIEAPSDIIDLGTGTGLWASLVADWFDGTDHPPANVVGVDLAPQQDSSVQTNLYFEVDDITNDWATHILFDLVHIRMLWGVINDWPKVFAESFRHMKSGGYLQFADADSTPRCDDGTMPDDTIFATWHQTAHEFAELSGRRFFDAMATKREIEDAGFVEIEEKRYKVPIGGWSSDPRYRELGRLYGKYWETGMEGWLLTPAMEYLGWSKDKVQNVLKNTQDVITKRNQHVYHYLVVIYAKKP